MEIIRHVYLPTKLSIVDYFKQIENTVLYNCRVNAEALAGIKLVCDSFRSLDSFIYLITAENTIIYRNKFENVLVKHISARTKI